MKGKDFGKVQGLIAGNKVRVEPGEYEVVSYTAEGPAHSQDFIRLDKTTEALAIEEVWPQTNVVVRNEHNQHVVIMVDPKKIK